MNKRYEIQEVVDGRYAVWYMPFENNRSKYGVWRIIDLYSGTRATKFAFRKKVKGKEKTQEQLDALILGNAIKYFNKKNIFRGTKFENAEMAGQGA